MDYRSGREIREYYSSTEQGQGLREQKGEAPASSSYFARGNMADLGRPVLAIGGREIKAMHTY